jgi:hypothetical protein
VSCKSWQAGFHVKTWLSALEHGKTISGRPAWKFFRELMIPKWSEALMDAVKRETGSRRFTYVTAVTAIVGDRAAWEQNEQFLKALGGNRVRMLELAEMLRQIEAMASTTLASSDIGRVLQLMRAAKKDKATLLETVKAQSDN